MLRGRTILIAAIVAAHTPPLEADASSAPETRRTPQRPARWILEAPERALDLIAWPLGRAVEWAERTDLPERVTDALYFDEERTAGWLPNVSFGGGVDSGVGAKVFHNSLRGGGEEIELSTLFSGTDESEREIGFRYFDPSPGQGTVSLLVDVLHSEDRDEDFFVRVRPDGSVGLGRSAFSDDEVEIGLRLVRGRFQAAVAPARGVSTGLALEPIYGSAESGEGPNRGLPETLAGFGESILLVGGGPFFEWDARDAANRPRSGWLVRLRSGAWSAGGEETAASEPFRYARYRLDLRRYQPTFRHDRTIVVRALLDRVETIDGAVPFWELPALDEDTGLRGFERNRFRDRGAALLNLEYRYPVWDTWDAFLFVDEGQVFDEWSAVAIDRFEWSAGAGVQFLTASGFLFQIRLARSDEDQRFKIDLARPF